MDKNYDILIVGSGISGSLAAYTLSKMGKKVGLISKRDALAGPSATAHTTAFVTNILDVPVGHLIKMYGIDKTRDIWQIGVVTIDNIRKIVKEENIDCGFMRVSEFALAENSRELEDLKDESESYRKIGVNTLMHIEPVSGTPNVGALEIQGQAKFDASKFVSAIRAKAIQNGVEMHFDIEAKDILWDSATGKANVKTSTGDISADWVIIASYRPFNNPKELVAHKVVYISYVMEAEIAKNSIPVGLYTDEANPYHYFRIDAGEAADRIIIGGEDHRQDIPIGEEKNYKALEAYLQRVMNGGPYKILRRWHGWILETIDGLPYIGAVSPSRPKELYATGFSGNGMIYSMIAADIFRDEITGTLNKYKSIYAAGRQASLTNVARMALHYIGLFFGGAFKNFFQR